MLLAAVAVLILTAFVLLFLRLRSRNSKEPPNASVGFPIIGTAVAFGTDPPKYIRDSRQKFGDVFTSDLGVVKITWLCGPAGSRTLLKASESALSLREAAGPMLQGVFGVNPYEFDLDWTAVSMDLVSAGFMKLDRLQLYVDLMVRETDRAIERWTKMDSIDVFRECARLVFRINLSAMIGPEIAEQYGDEYCDRFVQIEQDMTHPVVQFCPWLPSPVVWRLRRNRDAVYKFVTDSLRDAARKAEDGDKRSDYLQFIIGRVGSDWHPLILPMHILALLFAAHTNTAGHVSWLVAETARSEPAKQAIRREFERVSEAAGGVLTAAALNGMKYLDSCAKEVTRIYAAPMAPRKVKADFEYNGYTIPAGRLVCGTPYLSHHDPEIFHDPETFVPDRFLDSAFTQKVTSEFAFVQFGFGPHRCLGERYVSNVMRVILGKLHSECDVTYLDDGPLPPYDKSRMIGGTMFATAPMHVRVARRRG